MVAISSPHRESERNLLSSLRPKPHIRVYNMTMLSNYRRICPETSQNICLMPRVVVDRKYKLGD
jgi:hypothetical protein